MKSRAILPLPLRPAGVKAKNAKKVNINSNFAEFSRTPQWSENQD